LIECRIDEAVAEAKAKAVAVAAEAIIAPTIPMKIPMRKTHISTPLSFSGMR